MFLIQKDPTAQLARERFLAVDAQTRVSFLNRDWDILDASPTDRIDVVQGYDQDGLEVWATFMVGDLVTAPGADEPWRIVGFTKGNLVLTRPHGIRPADDLRSGVTFNPTLVNDQGLGLQHWPEKAQEGPLVHKDGLVAFG